MDQSSTFSRCGRGYLASGKYGTVLEILHTLRITEELFVRIDPCEMNKGVYCLSHGVIRRTKVITPVNFFTRSSKRPRGSKGVARNLR